MKKILIPMFSVVLTIILQVFLTPIEAGAEQAYVLATDDDFSGTSNGSFRYIGTDEYVEIPHVIKGENVTSYSRMFEYTEVKGVKSANKNVTNMNSMFSNSRATELDVSSFDTSNVTNMNSMFDGSHATELDLSNFDTSKVTNMVSMFRNSRATELDLSSFDTSNVTYMVSMFGSSQATELDVSSFDTSNVTNMNSMFSNSRATELDLSSFDTSNVASIGSMFNGSHATTGYARTQEDADNFNGSTNKPAGLVFEVKGLISEHDDVDITISAGDFSLEVPQIATFGNIDLQSTAQEYTTNFAGNFIIKDLRGTHGGWSLNVDASTFTNGEDTLPNGSITLAPVGSVEHLGTELGDLPQISTTTTQTIDDGTIEVLNAENGTGMGGFEFKFPTEALTIKIDPTTAKVGTYESTLTWDLVSAP